MISDIGVASGSLSVATMQRDVVIITDQCVASHHLKRVEASLRPRRLHTIVLPEGEKTKTLRVAQAVVGRLLREGYGRDALLIGLGGGVIGDLTGLVASIYLRGVEYLLVPTTLLAQVDAAIGGKTGVDHALAKNAIGTFWFPTKVFVDVNFLSTLHERHYRAGFAEVIKYALAFDPVFFTWLEERVEKLRARAAEELAEAVRRSIDHKIDIVRRDPYEQVGLRALLNLGHTFAHAIETYDGYQHWLHGEAVAVGLDLASECSYRLGWIESEARVRITQLLQRFALPIRPPSAPREIIYSLMHRDKKKWAGKLRLVLLEGIGRAILTTDYAEQVIRDVLYDAFEYPST